MNVPKIDKYLDLSPKEFFAKVYERAIADIKEIKEAKLKVPSKIDCMSHAAYDVLGLVEDVPNGLKYRNEPDGYNEAPGALLYELYEDDKAIWLPLATQLKR